MQIFAQVNNQGTAMAETALCRVHLPTHSRHCGVDYSEILGKEDGYRKIPLDDPSWHNCTDNDALSCNACGITGGLPDLVGKAVSAMNVDGGALTLHFTDKTEVTVVVLS